MIKNLYLLSYNYDIATNYDHIRQEYRAAGSTGYCHIRLHIFLTLPTSGWQKSLETGGYGMAAKESRNNSQILLLHLGDVSTM